MNRENKIVDRLVDTGNKIEERMQQLGGRDISQINPNLFESDEALSSLIQDGSEILASIGLYDKPKKSGKRSVRYMPEPHYLAIQITDTASIMGERELDEGMGEIMELLSMGNPAGLAVALDVKGVPRGTTNEEIFQAAIEHTRWWFLQKRRNRIDH